MGVAVENDLHIAGTGVGKKTMQAHFYAMAMTVGHKDPNATQLDQLGFRIRDPATVHIAITGHLVDGDLRILFLHGLSVTVIVTQMDHRIGMCSFNAATHKGKACVRIG